MGDANTEPGCRSVAGFGPAGAASVAGASDAVAEAAPGVVVPFPDNAYQRLLRLAETIEREVAERLSLRWRFHVLCNTGEPPRIPITATCFIDVAPQGQSYRCFAESDSGRQLLLQTDDPSWIADLVMLCVRGEPDMTGEPEARR